MNKSRHIPVSAPVFAGNEERYVLDCIRSGWISSNGEYIEKFERAFAEYIGTRYAICCSNGTVALHLALLGVGIGPGDEVIVPDLTFVATANAVVYCGAEPVFIDSEPQSWNLDPQAIEALVTERTKAIIVVHLYGHPANMDQILSVARKHNLAVIEDAAEAHGAEYHGRRCGSLGTVSTFSFYGNKAITTGEGGIVMTDDANLASKIRILRGQGQDPNRRYWFPVIGYNYRMTNICAAIGLAQTEKIEWHVSRRREVAQWYTEKLSELDSVFILQEEAEWALHSYWMFSILLKGASEDIRDEIIRLLSYDGIETRPIFYPMHLLPPYRCSGKKFPCATKIGALGLNLPTWAGLSECDVDFVCARLKVHAKALSRGSARM